MVDFVNQLCMNTVFKHWCDRVT